MHHDTSHTMEEKHVCTYSHFRGFSPDCTLHTAITCVISVLEWQSLLHDYTIHFPVRLRRSNTAIT